MANCRVCRRCGSEDFEDVGVTNVDPWWMNQPRWLKDIRAYKSLRESEKNRLTRMNKALQVLIPISPRSEDGRAKAKDVLYLGARYRTGVFGAGGRKDCSAKYDIDKYPWEQSISFWSYWQTMKPDWWEDSWVPEGFWDKWDENGAHYVELARKREELLG